MELAGGIAHNDVLQQQVNCSGRTVIPLGDNTTATTHEQGRDIGLSVLRISGLIPLGHWPDIQC